MKQMKEILEHQGPGGFKMTVADEGIYLSCDGICFSFGGEHLKVDEGRASEDSLKESLRRMLSILKEGKDNKVQ